MQYGIVASKHHCARILLVAKETLSIAREVASAKLTQQGARKIPSCVELRMPPPPTDIADSAATILFTQSSALSVAEVDKSR